MFQSIFWVSLFLVFWTYAGYFIFLYILAALKAKPIEIGKFTPDISIIITAHNEEKRIRQKLDNTISLSYPEGKLEIIIVSDGSTDSTNEIADSYRDKGVRLLTFKERHGKHYCLGKGIESAAHEIVVLTDATTFLRSDALLSIVGNFADTKIGCVSGADRIRGRSVISGEGAYVRYEMKLRLLESRVNSLVSASGSFYAVRKKLCSQWRPNMSADFYLPIQCYMAGYRSVLEPDAIGYYDVIDNSREFQRKVRTVVHGIDVLYNYLAVLNPFRHGLFSLQIISHKLIRWLVPLCLAAIFVSDLVLFQSGLIYKIFFYGQILFYGIAITSFAVRRLQAISFFKIPFYFSMANLSILVAWIKYMMGERYITWDATKR